MGAHPQINDWVVVPELPDLFQRMERKILTMEKLRAKLKENSGFTLIEMLIVVAVIAVLVAVSIPMVSSALDRVRCTTDAANERSAKAIAAVQFLSGEIKGAAESEGTNGAYLYKAGDGTGTLVPWSDSIEKGSAYGKCVTHGHQDAYLWVKVLEDGTIQLAWAKKINGTAGVTWDKDLCGDAH